MEKNILLGSFQSLINGGCAKWLAVSLILVVVACAKPQDEKKQPLTPDDDIIEDFDTALKAFINQMNTAIDAEIEEEHFDYDKAQVNFSVSSTNSIFEKFTVDIRYLQLIDIDGYSFTLFDHVKAGKPMPIDFAQVNQISRLLIAQPHVPVNAYKFLVVEFGFKNAEIKADGTTVHLISDDGLTFGKDQINYRISVDLGAEPEMVVQDGLYALDMALHLDDSVLPVPFLDNALPEGEKAMIFHPSLWMGKMTSSVMVEGQWDMLEDISIKMKPSNINTSKKYRDYFDVIDLQINNATAFSINGQSQNYDEATAQLVTKGSGFVALKGKADINDNNIIHVESLVYHNEKPSLWQGFSTTLPSQPSGIESFMVWVDEMPPNYQLNQVLGNGAPINQIAIDGDLKEKTHKIHRIEGQLASNDANYPSVIGFESNANLALEGYSLLNPHISRHTVYAEIGEALKTLIEDGAFAYSVLVQGEASAGKITAKNKANHYAKFRYRGRTIDGALARTVFDDDIHGEKKWGGLTLSQIGAIFGSAMGLLLLEVILERKKLGPVSQLRAPDFCKPNKKASKGASASADGASVRNKLKSAGSAIAGIGGVASCLKKLSTFSASEPELSRFSRQINADALYLEGTDGSKHSALAMLRNKKLSKKGLDFYQLPENVAKLNRVLQASKKLKKVLNTKFGVLRELNSSIFLDGADRLKMNLTKKMRTDVDLYTKVNELDPIVMDQLLKVSDDMDLSDVDTRKKFYEGVKAATKAQDAKKTVGEVAEAFNEKMSDDSYKINIDDSEKSVLAESINQKIDQQIVSLDDIEDALLRYQVDPSEINKSILNAALGADDSASIDPQHIHQQIEDQRQIISTELISINRRQAEVLKKLNDSEAFESETFFKFQAERVIREKLIDDTKRAVISVASSEDKLSVSKLKEAYSNSRNSLLSVTNKDVESHKQKLDTSLEKIIGDGQSLIDPSKIIKPPKPRSGR
ncbi:MAG: hypothetical protein OXE99_08405 [Cellvibrionales bacterium]|nr:hypothetical protein [Cellvibrionales bacterium]